MVVTRHGFDTTSPKAESSSKKSQPTQKRRRDPKDTETTGSGKKRKASARKELEEAVGEAHEQTNSENFHDSSLLPAFEEAAVALQNIHGHIEDAGSTDDNSVLQVSLNMQSPTQTAEILVTPSTRKETTAEPDGSEGDVTQYFTPQTTKRSNSKRGNMQENGTSSTSTAELKFQTPTTHSKRIRFSSKSPEPELATPNAKESLPPSTPIKQTQPTASDQADSDDDAAPEEITTAAAQPASAHPAVKPSRRKAAQQNAARKKRRERTASKAEQASAALTANTTQAEEKEEDDDEANPDQRPALDINALPATLPAHILAAAARARAPAHPAASAPARPQLSGRRSTVRALPRPPRDVRRGPVAVRVLRGTSALLPPPAGGQSCGVREAWLRGRVAKGKGARRVERRPFGRAARVFV